MRVTVFIHHDGKPGDDGKRWLAFSADLPENLTALDFGGRLLNLTNDWGGEIDYESPKYKTLRDFQAEIASL